MQPLLPRFQLGFDVAASLAHAELEGPLESGGGSFRGHGVGYTPYNAAQADPKTSSYSSILHARAEQLDHEVHPVRTRPMGQQPNGFLGSEVA